MMSPQFSKLLKKFGSNDILKTVKKEQGFGLLDLALLVIASLLIFTEAKVLFFHIIFVTLTFGAFYWKFGAFVVRSIFWVSLTTTVVFIAILDGKTQAAELVEIPLLSLILVLVFAIARQRAKAEKALRLTNEELEHRVETRTAELTRVNAQLTREVADHTQTQRIRRQLSSVVEQTTDFVMITNKEGIIEYVNPAFQKELGYTPDELIGRSPRMLKSNQHDAKFYEELWKTILSGNVYQDVFINKKKNGDLYFEDKTITPLRDSNGTITHFVSTGRDITKRKKAEEALLESEERYRRLIELSFEAIVIHGEEGFIHLNTPGAEMFGASRPDQLIGKPIFDFVHSDYLSLVQKRLDRLHAASDGVPLVEEKFIQLDGTTVDVEVAAVPIVYRGKPAIQTVIRNITPRKQAEAEREKLLKTEREHRFLAETLGDVFLALTAQINREDVLDEILRQVHRLVSCSAANIMLLKDHTLHIARHQGYQAYEEIISRLEQPLTQFPLDAEVVRSQQPVIVSDTRQNDQWVTTPESIWIKSFIAVPICAHEQVIGLLRLDSDTPEGFSNQDIKRLQPLANAAAIALENARLFDQAQLEIAERRQAEKELRQIAARNQAILDTIPDSIFQFNRNGQLLDYRIRGNNWARGILGNVSVGQNLSDLLPPDVVKLTLHCIDTVLDSHEMEIIEYQLPSARGIREFETRLVASGSNEVLAIIADITERKARQAAVENERARIARDLHDSLGQSLGYLHLKLDELAITGGQKRGNKVQHDLLQMRDVANEAYELVRSMLAAARPTNSIDLGTALLAEAKLVGNRAGFKVQLDSTGQPLLLSPIVQQQVLYIFKETLSNVEKHAQAKQIQVKIVWTSDTVTIALTDDGCGFKTSDSRTDNHYGLAIMEERAGEIGGILSVVSHPDFGTEVTLELSL